MCTEVPSSMTGSEIIPFKTSLPKRLLGLSMEDPTPPLDTPEVVGGLKTRLFEGPSIELKPLGKGNNNSSFQQMDKGNDKQASFQPMDALLLRTSFWGSMDRPLARLATCDLRDLGSVLPGRGWQCWPPRRGRRSPAFRIVSIFGSESENMFLGLQNGGLKKCGAQIVPKMACPKM